MNYLNKFFKFNETRGVADATLYLLEPILNLILEKTLDFIDSGSKTDAEYIETELDYKDLKDHLPKKSVYSLFPVSKIILDIDLSKVNGNFSAIIGGSAYKFGKKKWGLSSFRKGVKKNADHSISIKMDIKIEIGAFNPEDRNQMNSFLVKLESCISHELNHLYEYYNREWDPQGRNIQTSITWASIGGAPPEINEDIFKYWQDNFLLLIYSSEPHEINATVQEAKSYVDRLSYKDFKKTDIWKNIKKMQKFDENKFLENLHEEALRIDLNLIESEILLKLIKSWKKEYKKLYRKQDYQNNPSPEFFKKMSDAQFMQFWGKKIREAGERLLRRVLRLYSDE